MKKTTFIPLLIFTAIISMLASFKEDINENNYTLNYTAKLNDFKARQAVLLSCIEKSNLHLTADVEKIKEQSELNKNSVINYRE